MLWFLHTGFKLEIIDLPVNYRKRIVRKHGNCGILRCFSPFYCKFLTFLAIAYLLATRICKRNHWAES